MDVMAVQPGLLLSEDVLQRRGYCPVVLLYDGAVSPMGPLPCVVPARSWTEALTGLHEQWTMPLAQDEYVPRAILI
ncbi:hypothetical protein SNOG_07721 [Parastagonospora nodorum SN15]|uniref:Uncharacterized protein n=1 Tax=Phaeosphaeria nodorum (strain SN15 / ATCC MYA-4574 / FGSC 10173) TaxID=321614 RepID=Q0UKJ3_PHANO|nr:hypothetical protein SNOG_07721 [Parastagonospora nodorum SN15]EAT85187.1 hypothetical protein SNOG_07721 [Parastagonospora nodorum SN15]